MWPSNPPCFTDNVTVLNTYLAGRDVAGVLVTYHGVGTAFLLDAPKYAIANAAEYARNGCGKALIDQFTPVLAVSLTAPSISSATPSLMGR